MRQRSCKKRAKLAMSTAETKNVVCVADELPKTDTTIDILSFDIGTVNMGVARVRYDFARGRVCVMNAMLLNIFHPFQMLNENDKHDESIASTTAFPVAAYEHHRVESERVANRQILNCAYSEKQRVSRKRARIVEKTEHALQFASDRHPERTAKRRRAKIEQSTLPKTLADNWALIGAQLTLALSGHAWMANMQDLEFILLEQQDRTNPKARAICMSIVTFYETKRHTQTDVSQRRQTDGYWHLAPFIKICSASNKLAQKMTAALRSGSWTMQSVAATQVTSGANQLTDVQTRALLKKHFHLPTSDVANSETYSKRKISSVDEITAFFCSNIIAKARAQSATPLPEKCEERVVQMLAREPVNAYAHWIINQLKEKNNVTDALLQAFSWIEQCEVPPSAAATNI